MHRLCRNQAIIIVCLFSTTYDVRRGGTCTRPNLNPNVTEFDREAPMGTKEAWITRKANAAAKRAATLAIAQEAVQQAQTRVSRQTTSAAPERGNQAPVPAPRPSASPSACPSACPELTRRSPASEELADYRRAVFGSAMDERPYEPVIAPQAPPRVRKQVFEYEGRFYEDRGLERETQDVESYVCSRGLCYRTKLHRIEVELVLVPEYPRHTIGIEYEVGEPKNGLATWVPKNGLRIPYASLGDNQSR